MSERILIVYGTTEGHTETIAAHIAAGMVRAGQEVRLERVERLPSDIDLAGYAGVIVGASIHMGKHQRGVVDFVKKHREALERTHNAFFSVSMVSAQYTEASHREAMELVERFEADTGWRPERVALFAGALLYTHYGFIKRYIVSRIEARKGGPTDTSHDYVFTNWSSVSHFADDFLAAVRAPPPEAEEPAAIHPSP